MGIEAKLLHAGDRIVPDHGHLIATQIVDAGINIKGITCVIDTGTMLINHKGSMELWLSDVTNAAQRKGRTGRFCDGLYISLHTPGKEKQVSYPSLASYFEDPARYSIYEISSSLQRITSMAVTPLLWNGFAGVDNQISDDELLSLSTWHYIRLNEPRPEVVQQRYQKVFNGKPDERDDYIFSLVLKNEGSLVPLPTMLQLIKTVTVYYAQDAILRDDRWPVMKDGHISLMSKARHLVNKVKEIKVPSITYVVVHDQDTRDLGNIHDDRDMSQPMPKPVNQQVVGQSFELDSETSDDEYVTGDATTPLTAGQKPAQAVRNAKFD